MNSFIKFLIFIVISSIATTFLFNTGGLAMGFGAMILSFMALFLIYKPKILYIIGRNKYLKNHDEGFKYMEKAYDTGRLKAQDILIYSYLLLRDGHLTKADKLITGTLHQSKSKLTDKNLQAAKLNQAIILWKRGNIAAAIVKMEEVYDSGYRSTVHYQTLGLFYVLNNNLEKAEEFIKEALTFNKDDASIRDNLGLLYIKKGQWEEAEEVYEDIFDETNPTFIEAYYNYATVLEHFEDWEEACDYYQKALGCPERFLSTVKLSLVESRLSSAEEHLK